MKAIVTGANGFVGSALVKKLALENIEVLAIDLSFQPSRLDSLPNVKTLELSVEKINVLKEKSAFGEYELFFHFAWLGSAGPLRGDLSVQTKNVTLTTECLRLASEIGCKRFVCAGSIMEFEVIDNVYNNTKNIAINNIYSAAKEYAHLVSKPLANSYGIELVWAYITNAYGEGEISPRFINTTIRKICNNEKLEFTSGVQNYDFVYIDDVANAFYLIGTKGIANKGYMIGSGIARPLKEFVLEMCQVLNAKSKPVFGNVQYDGANLSLDVFSIDELVNDCGYSPVVGFSEGIKRTKEWLVAQ